ncbi:MAG TPA: hypothetical protein PLZ31_10190 [Myxococcota bacterium]|nr:hypothetical protein [Myxococcota bacterium]
MLEENDEDRQARYDLYIEERKTIGEQQFRTAQAFDKAILTVSSCR